MINLPHQLRLFSAIDQCAEQVTPGIIILLDQVHGTTPMMANLTKGQKNGDTTFTVVCANDDN
jgi:hypothetical protein